MYATDVFNFNASDNSELISLNFIIRACYLTFAFPAIINTGRAWLDKRDEKKRKQKQVQRSKTEEDESYGAITTDIDRLASTAFPAGEANTVEPEEPIRRTITNQSTKSGKEIEESFAFDLLYTRYSLVLDAVLTFLATFAVQGWQLYVVAIVIPFAAGTGSAAKGTMLQMCTPDQRTDALSAISLLEMAARLSTTSVFGLVFSAFAEVGRPSLTFAANAGVAVVGFVVLLFARFPPQGAIRHTKSEEEGEDDGGE